MFKKYLKATLIICILDIIVTGVICYFKNLMTLDGYSTALLYSGIVLMLLGVLSFIGNMKMRTNIGYQYGRMLGGQNQEKRIREDMEYSDKSIKFTILMVVCAMVCIGISIVISIL
jgi:hypothetical protein